MDVATGREITLVGVRRRMFGGDDEGVG